MDNDIIKDIMEENQKLRNENIVLKGLIESLKAQISELRSDIVTERANLRNRP